MPSSRWRDFDGENDGHYLDVCFIQIVNKKHRFIKFEWDSSIDKKDYIIYARKKCRQKKYEGKKMKFDFFFFHFVQGRAFDKNRNFAVVVAINKIH